MIMFLFGNAVDTELPVFNNKDM